MGASKKGYKRTIEEGLKITSESTSQFTLEREPGKSAGGMQKRSSSAGIQRREPEKQLSQKN